jgi:hypothetical protein
MGASGGPFKIENPMYRDGGSLFKALWVEVIHY